MWSGEWPKYRRFEFASQFIAALLTARDRFAYAPIWAENYAMHQINFGDLMEEETLHSLI